MRRAILSFELPEDEDAYRQCNMGADMWGVLWDIDNTMRSWLKHSDLSDDAQWIAQLVRDMVAQVDLNCIQ